MLLHFITVNKSLLIHNSFIPLLHFFSVYSLRVRKHYQIKWCRVNNNTLEVFVNNTNLTFYTKLASRCVKKLGCLQWELNSQLTIIGLQVWYLSNCAKQTCVDSIRLSDPYKVMLYWTQKGPKSKKWSGAWNKSQFKDFLFNKMHKFFGGKC